MFAQTLDAGTSESITLDYTTLDYDSTGTFLTGIRGDTLTGQYVIPESGANGGLIDSTTSDTWTAFPETTANGVNFPGAIDNTPYGPSFGSFGGILRVVGSYETSASTPYDIGYLYESAVPPGDNITTLQYPNSPGATTLFTIAHSTFGDQVVGDYDTQLATGNAFIYNISSGTYTSNDKPGAISTTAYGVWGDVIAGVYILPGGQVQGFTTEVPGIYNPIENAGAIATSAPGTPGITAAPGDDVLNDGVIVSGVGSAAVEMNGTEGTLLNADLLRAAPLGGSWTLENSARASWVHEFATERGMTASFEANATASFFVVGAPAASDSALLTDAVYFVRGPKLALFVAFGADVSGQGQTVGGSAGPQMTS